MGSILSRHLRFRNMKQRRNMKDRERILLTIDHKEPDRVPITFSGTKELQEKLCSYFHKDLFADVLKIFKATDGLLLDYVTFHWPDTEGSPAYTKRHSDGTREDYLGMKWKDVKYEGGVYSDVCYSPLASATTESEVRSYVDRILKNTEAVDKAAEGIAGECLKKDRGEKLIAYPAGALFTVTCWIRNMENLMIDMALGDVKADILINGLAEKEYREAEEALGISGKHLDILVYVDDFGSQNGLLISRDMWRKYFRKHLTEIFALAHSYGLKTYLHSCGSVRELIPDFIDIGLDILNPVQVNAAGMNPIELKKEYGGYLTFYGGLDSQKLIPFGTPAEIKEQVKHTMDIFKSGGGYIFGTTHNLQVNDPIDNIIALYETANEFAPYT